jgi:hypothetical protein
MCLQGAPQAQNHVETQKKVKGKREEFKVGKHNVIAASESLECFLSALEPHCVHVEHIEIKVADDPLTREQIKQRGVCCDGLTYEHPNY